MVALCVNCVANHCPTIVLHGATIANLTTDHLGWGHNVTKISISDGNTKIGAIPSVSLVPVLDCANCAKCKGSCYALKAYRMYSQTRDAYHRNSEMAHHDRQGYFEQIGVYLQRKRPEYFRFHVAGDILDQNYIDRMADLARDNAGTKFLCFTKNYTNGIDYRHLPENLTVVLSCWPGQALPRNRTLPRAWMQDGTETRIPQGARECPGGCEDCKLCYGLTGSVVFRKH